MSEINFIPIVNEADIAKLDHLANIVWHDAFSKILKAEQIDYMVDKFQSTAAFVHQMKEENYQYYFIEKAAQTVGYTGISPQPEKGYMFLSKLYLLDSFRGQGISTAAISFIKQKTVENKLSAIRLTVNKGNERAIKVYEHLGFKRIDAIVTEIGKGFVMDDYVYELALSQSVTYH